VLRQNPLKTRSDRNDDLIKLAEIQCEAGAQHSAGSCGEWLNITALDCALVEIVNDVHEAALAGDSARRPMKCIIANTDCSDKPGFHWFAIAYDICHVSEPSLLDADDADEDMTEEDGDVGVDEETMEREMEAAWEEWGDVDDDVL
jgi:hypothetical protein